MSVPLCFHYPDTTFAKVQITKLFHKISSLLSLSIGAANILRAVKPQQMVSLLLCFITLTITYLVWHVFLQMQVCIRKLPDRLGVCQAQRLEHSASDIHKIVTALARPRITPYKPVRLWCGFGTWRHRFVMPSIRHMGENATRVALMLRVQSVKALTIFWPQYCFYFCHLPFFCTSACIAHQ